MKIGTKAEFYRLAFEGKCGNTPVMWRSLEDYWPHRHRYRSVSVRRTLIACGTMRPAVPFRELPAYLHDNRIEEGTYILSEIPTGQEGEDTLQGELTWSWGTWHLHYTLRGGFMREALRRAGGEVWGLEALFMLRSRLPAIDYDELMTLFDRYTHGGHEYPVIEFSLMRGCSAGRIPGRSVLIWEIRHRY